MVPFNDNQIDCTFLVTLLLWLLRCSCHLSKQMEVDAMKRAGEFWEERRGTYRLLYRSFCMYRQCKLYRAHHPSGSLCWDASSLLFQSFVFACSCPKSMLSNMSYTPTTVPNRHQGWTCTWPPCSTLPNPLHTFARTFRNLFHIDGSKRQGRRLGKTW